MRLWHKDLLEALPREQLVAQWRECSAIAGAIIKNGTPNHILVNKVLDYDFSHFISYAKYVRMEMSGRGYKTMDSVWNKIRSLKEDYTFLQMKDIFPEWHNDRYLVQCYYNLEEKYECGGISDRDFGDISTVMLKEHDILRLC